jgi:hypothetical protein
MPVMIFQGLEFSENETEIWSNKQFKIDLIASQCFFAIIFVRNTKVEKSTNLDQLIARELTLQGVQ